jgi:hypothetical protein
VRTAAQSNSPSPLGPGTTLSLYAPENVIYKPQIPPVEFPVLPDAVADSGRGTSLRAANAVSEKALRQYLAAIGSPLADYAGTLAASPYTGTIIGICAIEQYHCSRLPNGNNWNLWGLMKPGGGLQFFATADEGIAAIDAFLARAESRGRTTIESFRAWYCYSATGPEHICRNWEPVVLQVKAEVEAL